MLQVPDLKPRLFVRGLKYLVHGSPVGTANVHSGNSLTKNRHCAQIIADKFAGAFVFLLLLCGEDFYINNKIFFLLK